MKKIMVSVIAFSMTLLAACGKTSTLLNNSTEIPVDTTAVQASVEAKPWVSDYTWTVMKYGAIGTLVAVAFFAGAMYGAYLGHKSGFEAGQDNEYEALAPAAEWNRQQGQKEGMHQGWHAGAARQQAIDNAQHANDVQQLQQFAAQQYQVGEQNGLQAGRQQGHDAGFQEGVAEGLAQAQIPEVPAEISAPSFPVVPHINETPVFIPSANQSPYSTQAPANIPSVPVQTRNASQPQAPNAQNLLHHNSLHTVNASPDEYVKMGIMEGQKVLLNAVGATKIQYNDDLQVKTFSMPIPDRTKRMILEAPEASISRSIMVDPIKVNIVQMTPTSQAPQQRYIAPQENQAPQASFNAPFRETSVPFRNGQSQRQNQRQNQNQPEAIMERIVANPRAPITDEELRQIEINAGFSAEQMAQTEAIRNQFRNMNADVLGNRDQVPQIPQLYPEV